MPNRQLFDIHSHGFAIIRAEMPVFTPFRTRTRPRERPIYSLIPPKDTLFMMIRLKHANIISGGSVR